MEPRIGCRASGLGTGILLEGGIPMAETMQTLLQSIDEQLGDTNRQIETCVKSILDMSNNMVGSDIQRFYHPGEALTTMAERHILEKKSCIDPHTADITHMLKHMLEMLDKHPGCEESALQSLFQLSSLEGVCLPEISHDSVNHSLVSINAVENDCENRNEALWNEICNRLRKYYVQKLNGLPTSPLPAEIDLYTAKRLQYVQSLCSLYTPKEIWGKYRSLRSQQYSSQLLSYSGKGSTSSGIAFSKGVQHFERLVLFTQVMMQEDFQLFNSGVFGGVVGTLDAINEIYIDKLLDEIGILTDALQSELSTITVKTLTKSTKDEPKALPKSPSDTGSFGRYRGGLRKQQSKSLDSLLQEENFTDLQNLPTNNLGLIVRLVNCVLNMDVFVKHLRSLLTWEINTLSSRPQQPKRLKSALKSRRDSDVKLNSIRQSLMSDSGLLESGNFNVNFGPLGTQAMTAALTSSLKVVEQKAEEKDSWNWKSPFLKVSVDMAKCVELYIGDVSEKVIDHDVHYMEKHRQFEMVSLPDNLTGGRLDYPMKVSKGVWEFFQEVNLLLPLAKAFCESPVDVIRAAFVDCTSKIIKNIHAKTIKILDEVSEEYRVGVWFQLLSNSSFVRNQLLYYDEMLTSEDNRKKSFSFLYKQWCELTEHVSQLVIEYQHHTLATSVLQDAESHYWEDSKDFYEDERCSFSVQQWNLHMKALRSDLWTTCAPRAAQYIYTSTLCEALKLLERRYTRLRPSYKRTKQVRYDITAILLCVEELLFSGCVNMGMYLEPSTNQTPIYNIHTSCLSLLSVLAVLTSPLDVFYKVFKKNPHHHRRKPSRTSDYSHKLYVSEWLSWMMPSIFQPGKESLSDLQTTNALYLQLKLTFSQPDKNWALFLEALVMKDYTLPIMLLTQVARHYSRDKLLAATEDSDYEEPADNPSPLSSVEHGPREEMDRAVERVFSDFVEVLILLEGFPGALAKVLLPVFERTRTWHLLDNSTTLGESHPIPPWIQAVMNCLQTFVKRLVEPGVKVFLEKQGKKPSGELANSAEFTPFSSVMSELPCGCAFTNSVDDSARKTPPDEEQGFLMEENITGHKELLAEAVYSVITQMNDDIYMLPTPLIMFFKAAQDQLSQKGLHSTHNCLAIKLLATCVRDMFLDTDQIQAMLGVSLDQAVKDNMQALGECTYYVLTAESNGKSSGIPKMASMFMKANRNWLNEQVELLSDHFSNDIFELPDPSNSLHGMPEDYIEQLMTCVVSHLYNSPYGLHPLRSTYNLVYQNLDWICDQLDIPPSLGSPSQSPPHKFQLVTSPPASASFNPLQEFNLIGSAKFDQEAVQSFEYEWQSLLQSDLGLSESGFKQLLFNRHEMQEGAYLEEEEKKPVQVLRRKYDSEEGAELV